MGWQFSARKADAESTFFYETVIGKHGAFGTTFNDEVFFPLWYPALVFALAAILAIRIGRFTLRSALVGMSVVAALLAMVVAL